MALYLISYDIAEKDSFEYEGLWATLKKMGAGKVLYSEWLITGGTNEAQLIYNKIAPCIQGKDRLLVQEIGSNSAWDKLLISDDNFRKWLAHARF